MLRRVSIESVCPFCILHVCHFVILHFGFQKVDRLRLLKLETFWILVFGKGQTSFDRQMQTCQSLIRFP